MNWKNTFALSLLLVGVVFPITANCAESNRDTAVYQAIKCPQPSSGSTWAILNRDGANRPTPPYLSSLGQGESGTGVISSPPFVIHDDTITFTICGHDGQGGGRGENYIALVDARKGKVLLQTPPPSNDAMQPHTWDVRKYQGVEARIEVHDGNRGSAFAWFGIGRIDGGSSLHVDFQQGLPANWKQVEAAASISERIITDGVPFRTNAAVHSIIPSSGSVDIPCGFSASRLFVLGCTVTHGEPLATYGAVEIHYQDNSVDIVRLTYGFTLDGQYKTLTPFDSLQLHPSGDPYQYYMVITPRPQVIQQLRLVANPERGPIPRISALTCVTSAKNSHLLPLPPGQLSEDEAAWITSHSITAATLEQKTIETLIGRSYHLALTERPTPVRFHKQQLDTQFRSEGLAVADLNGDGHLDIAAGDVYFAGPDWTMHDLRDPPRAFPQKGYSDTFLCFADDLNQDKATDLIVVGFPGQTTRWLENPGSASVPWKEHLAIQHTGNESPAYTDVDGDGQRELVFMDGTRCATARPGKDPTKPWPIRHIGRPEDPGPGHGLGIGDLNADGRPDILIPDGWWEAPRTRSAIPWQFHAATLFGGAQLCVHDLDGDGDADVLGTSPHGYGIAWTEQTANGWDVHTIDSHMSQTHAVALADLNGDGQIDFVTGKRFWAHNGHDPGSHEPVMLYWYELQLLRGRPVWFRHTIDNSSGVGLHFHIIDINGDNLLDIVTSNKLGVCLFLQEPRH